MKIVSESHLDHSLREDQIAYLLEKFADRDGFFIETIELPESLGTVPCGLHGPVMGDEPVPESEVTYAKRGDRNGESRLVNRPTRPVRQVTVIAGPHGEGKCVLYTAFGGPLANPEPFDEKANVDPKTLRDCKEFWSEHALSA